MRSSSSVPIPLAMPIHLLVTRLIFLTFTIRLLAVSTPAYSQFELRSATVITQSDTLLGQVNYYDWDVSPTAINFTPSGGTTREVAAKEIRRMVIAPDRVYDGRQVSFSVYKKSTSSIAAALVGQPTTAYLLLELLLESDAVRFYRFFDGQNRKRFFLEKDGLLHPLDYIQTMVTTDTKRGEYDNPLFRNKLKTLLNECPTLRTDDLSYTETDIMALLREYHSYCRIDSRVYQEQQDYGKIKISLGAVNSHIPSANDVNDPIRYGKAMQLGLSIRLLLPQRFNNYFLIAEVARISYQGATINDFRTNLAVYGGRYFGTGAVQGMWYTGMSIVLGPLDTGAGLSYKKMLSVSASLPVFYQLVSGFSRVTPPTINVRLHLPLTK
ncbi:hypothetical protein JYG30_10615 [Fibrella sp. USSR17]